MIPQQADRTHVVRALQRDLKAEVHVADVDEVAGLRGNFDAAVVGLGLDESALSRIAALPTVAVGPAACNRDIRELAQAGVQGELPARCLRCTTERLLATNVLWAIERSNLVRRLRMAEERHLRAALHDPLTGLPNVRLFRDRFRQLQAQAKRSGKRFALFILDLDRFKAINDRWGHEAGNRVLRAVADALRACVRETDTVARIGGDEFAILFDDVRDGDDADRLALRILERVSKPCVASGNVVRASLSIGIAVSADGGESTAALERRADRAMYAAKRSGGNAFRHRDARHGAGPRLPRATRPRALKCRPRRAHGTPSSLPTLKGQARESLGTSRLGERPPP